MDLFKGIRELENNNVFIYFSYDHYKNGTNCSFSIEFRDIGEQTGWFGDNHEFGDVADVFKTAVEFAKYLSNDQDLLTAYFSTVPETISSEGQREWEIRQSARKRIDEFLYSIAEKGWKWLEKFNELKNE